MRQRKVWFVLEKGSWPPSSREPKHLNKVTFLKCVTNTFCEVVCSSTFFEDSPGWCVIVISVYWTCKSQELLPSLLINTSQSIMDLIRSLTGAISHTDMECQRWTWELAPLPSQWTKMDVECKRCLENKLTSH